MSERIRVDCVIEGQFGKALKIVVDDGPQNRVVFLPISQVCEIHNPIKGEGYVVIPVWLAKKENLL